MGAAVVQIEHIGSTAVPGLAAKPVIDIAVGIVDLAQAPACVPLLESIGYNYVPELETELSERRFYCPEVKLSRGMPVFGIPHPRLMRL